MVGKQKARNAEEHNYIHTSKHLIGCVPCALLGFHAVPADFHHIIDGNKRLGHMYGFGMCLWHHRGERDWTLQHIPHDEIQLRIGPSFARSPRAFQDLFGTQLLLADLNMYMVDRYDQAPWGDRMDVDALAHMRVKHGEMMSCAEYSMGA